jgi:uncharacterized protein (DUF4415 family)
MLTKSQVKEIQVLKRMRDDEIDVTDLPPLQNWNQAEIGKFYRPIKKSLTIRVDADVLAWLRGQGKGYQTRINALLREAMNRPASSPIPPPKFRSVTKPILSPHPRSRPGGRGVPKAG